MRLLTVLAFMLFAPVAALAEMRLVMVEQAGCAYCAAWDEAIGPIYGPELPPAIQPIIDAITEPKKEESRNWESSSYSVNEMQRRGLGMGGEFVNKEEKQQVTLLQSIEKVLKQASTTGGLQWA